MKNLFMVFVFVLIYSFVGFTNLSAQALIDNGSTQTINANGSGQNNGSAQDYTIPSGTTYNSISFTLKGGDGGSAEAGTQDGEPCISEGGEGATVTVKFMIGTGANRLEPGGTIRFIVGKHGVNGVTTGSKYTGGGGGGGTAVLYRPNASADWEILAVGGGGGGAYQANFVGFCIDNQKGQGGRSTENGGDGEGDGSGNGGTDGNAGESGSSDGGGGAFQGNGGDGGGGKGFPAGGSGGTYGNYGGWGFGGGAGGSTQGNSNNDGGSGGGGGYSGGGGGGDIDNGGGGGSYTHPTYSISSSKTAGSSGGGNSQNGYVDYIFENTPIVWTGAVDNDWHKATNWSPSYIPAIRDLVDINAVSTDPVITSTANARVVRVFSGGDLTLESTSILNLHPISTNGIFNEGTITNDGGTINISRYNDHPNYDGIRNNGGTFINKFAGDINIDGMERYGIWNRLNGSFTNESGGEVNLGTVFNSIGEDGIQNDSGSSFVNNGNLNVRNTLNRGIVNEGSIVNQSSGDIKIDQTGIQGIFGTESSSFYNTGEIHLGQSGNIASRGIELRDNSTFQNQTTGTVNFWQSGSYGIYVRDNSIFENSGDLFLGGLGGSGIQDVGIVNLNSFSNKAVGEIFINQTASAGILNGNGATGDTGLFNNEGSITIGSNSNIDIDGIQNQSTFNNLTTGSIKVIQAFYNGISNTIGGFFTNEGSIELGENGSFGTNAILNNNGAEFLNMGCNAKIRIFHSNIKDSADNFTNSGQILMESSSNSNIHVNNGIILYNAGNFTADNGNLPVSVTENFSDIRLWTGCASSDWADSDNWALGSIPTDADEVVIYSFVNDPVIDPTTTAQTKYVYLENGATLTNNGILKVTDGAFWLKSGASAQGNGQYALSSAFIVENGVVFNSGTSTLTMTGTEPATIVGIPFSLYNLIIDKPSDMTVVIDSDVTVTNDLTVNSGDLKVSNGYSITCPHLYLPNGCDLTNSGTTSLTNGALWIQSGASAQGNGQYNIDGNFSLDGGTFTPGTSTVILNGSGNNSIFPDPITFHNLEINKPSDKRVRFQDVTVTNDLNVISGDLEIESDKYLTCPNLNLPNGSDLTNEGSVTVTNNTSTLLLQAGSSAQGNGQYTLEGSFILENDGIFNSGTSTVTMTGPEPSVIVGDPVSLYNLIIDKPSDDWVSIISEVTVTNDLTFNSGDLKIQSDYSIACPYVYLPNGSDLTNDGSITTNNGGLWIQSGASSQGNGQYSLSGSFSLDSGGSFESGTSTVTMTGTGNSSISGVSVTLYKLVIDKASDKRVDIGSEVTVDNELTISSGDLRIFSGRHLTCPLLTLPSGSDLTNHGSITTNGGGLLIQSGASAQGNGQYTFLGSFNLNSGGIFNPGTSTIMMAGTGQNFIAGEPISFYNLTVNKASNYTSLLTDITVSNELNMMSGNFNLNGNDIELTGNSSIIGESSASYIFGSSGVVKKTVDLIAPNSENPGNIGVNITSSANLGLTTVQRGHVIQDVNGEMSIVRYYDIEPTNNSGLDATVRFYYLDHELNGIPKNDLAPFRFNGTNWDEFTPSANDINANWVETNEVDAFSMWSMAASSSSLPVEWLEFNVRKVENSYVQLTWETAIEINNEGFEVEHSSDGLDWNYLGFVKGNGNSSTVNQYSYTHEAPTHGINYYRLVQVDYDGQVDYSDIKSINIDILDTNIHIYPNPAADYFIIQLPDEYEFATIYVSDSNGRSMFQKKIIDVQSQYEIDLNGWKSGMYLVSVLFDGKTSKTKKLQVIKN